MFGFVRDLIESVEATRNNSARALDLARRQVLKQERKIQAIYEQLEVKANKLNELDRLVQDDHRSYEESVRAIVQHYDARIQELVAERDRHCTYFKEIHEENQKELSHRIDLARDDYEAVEEQLTVEDA